MSAVTMSGEVNEVRPPRTRGLTNGQIRIADNSPAKTETMAAARRPAAVVEERLERLLLRVSEQPETRPAISGDTPRTADTDQIQDTKNRTASFDNPSKSMLAQHVQAQIVSRAEVAVLAQAHQMPNDAMAYSSRE